MNASVNRGDAGFERIDGLDRRCCAGAELRLEFGDGKCGERIRWLHVREQTFFFCKFCGRVIAALKRAGIADRDIQTSNLSLNPVYAQQRPRPDGTMEPEQPLIIGYQVSNTVSVRQRKLGEFGQVIDTLVSAGANQVNGPSFQIDNPDEALDEARTEAVAKARSRASLYARAAGLKVLRILSISESGGYAPQPMMMNTRAMASDAGGAPPVAAGEVSLNTSVTVQFELAP